MYNKTCSVTKLYSGLTGSLEARWTSFVENRFLATMPSVIIGENVSTAVISFNPVHTLASGGYVCKGSLESPILDTKLTTRLRSDITFQRKKSIDIAWLLYPIHIQYIIYTTIIIDFCFGGFQHNFFHFKALVKLHSLKL